jgi:hypothetical protein
MARDVDRTSRARSSRPNEAAVGAAEREVSGTPAIAAARKPQRLHARQQEFQVNSAPSNRAARTAAG